MVHPEPSFLRLFHGHFQPLTPPQTFDTFVIHLPACIPQQSCNPTIAVSAILAGQLDHVGDQSILIISANRQTPLCGSMLPHNPANPPFRHPHLVANVINASPAT
jgi:hypothetical protein